MNTGQNAPASHARHGRRIYRLPSGIAGDDPGIRIIALVSQRSYAIKSYRIRVGSVPERSFCIQLPTAIAMLAGANLTFTYRDAAPPKARRYCAMMQAARRGASLFTATLHACRLQIRTFSLGRAQRRFIRTLPRRREAKEQFANYIRLLATNPIPYRELHAATASGCTNGRRDIEPCRHTTEQCPAIYKQKIVLAT